MPRAAHLAVAAGVFFLAFAVWLVGGLSDGTTLVAVSDIAMLLFVVPAVVFSALAARASAGRVRLAWAALTVGVLSWGIGEALWTYYELVAHTSPFPSPADAAYLVFPVAACVGLLVLPGEQTGPFRSRALLDGLIVAAALFLVGWVTVLGPLYASGGRVERLAVVVAIAYPLSDVVVLTMATVVLVRSGARDRLPLTLVTVGVACIALSDSTFAYLASKGQYSSGRAPDIGWVAGLLFITVAAVTAMQTTRENREAQELPSWASIWLPYVPVLLAGVVAAANPPDLFRNRMVLAVAGLLVVAVLVRQFLAVSENRMLVAAVTEQALRDPLTGLANRSRFDDRLDHAMRMRQRDGSSVGVISLDLNDFKLVNDNLGHSVGDELLIGVADRLRGAVRSVDTVARPGGDEFCLLVSGGADAPHVVADRVARAFDQPFMIAGHELPMRPSIGLAIAGAGEPALSADEVMTRADTAMYAAKRSGNRGVLTYDPQMQLSAEADDGQMFVPAESESVGVEAIALLGDFRGALTNAELALVYQPKFDLLTERVVGVEALLRWNRPDGRVVTPKDFLPLVHRHGLTAPVTEFVLNRALDDMVSWHAASFDIPVSVNLFAASMANRGIPARLTAALSERGLAPDTLTVEVTEDVFLDNVERTRVVLEDLRRNGIRIAIDNFASGDSVLPLLRELPIDEVKLNRHFIAPVVDDPRAATVVRALLGLADGLGLAAVAEGVEDAETETWLRGNGCRLAQGHFLSPPLSTHELLTLLNRRAAECGETHTGRGVLG